MSKRPPIFKGDRFNAFVAEMYPYAGQVMLLYRSELVLFQGIGVDESDYYYIVDYAARNKERIWASAVGHMEPLKPFLPAETYDGMVNHFTLQKVTAKRFDLLAEDENGTKHPLSWDGKKVSLINPTLWP